MTGTQDDDVVQHVMDCDVRLLQPAVRRSADQVDALLHEDFVEFGASGRRWNRPDIIAELSAEPPGANEGSTASEMAGTRLADDVVFITYVTQRGSRPVLRSSLWRRTDAGWRVFFHQGTIAPAE